MFEGFVAVATTCESVWFKTGWTVVCACKNGYLISVTVVPAKD
jgi:hypothetical protein